MMNFKLNQADGGNARRTIDGVGVAMCLALTGLLYAVGVHPLLEQRREQQALSREVVTEQDEVAMLTASLMEVRRKYVQVQREVADNALRLEPLSALNRRVAELTEMARGAGLAVNGVRPGRATTNEHYRTVPVQVAGDGSFYAVERFLKQLYEQMPDVGVWSLQLERRGSDLEMDPQYQIDLVWYAAPPTE
ncbi:type 4a pilus biogenesis protein PilO [Phycisphaerales bacterium AB-hyl4]|uniref:Type 4a pilus biogenesis protein PilO n=1 Tax=Natronomicrosphaera hydrolytica TaxID=3242702 RepID=A0ABV4TZS9_9BACT